MKSRSEEVRSTTFPIVSEVPLVHTSGVEWHSLAKK